MGGFGNSTVAVSVLNHGASDSILDFAVMKVHADFVADLELSVIRLLPWHGKECIKNR